MTRRFARLCLLLIVAGVAAVAPGGPAYGFTVAGIVLSPSSGYPGSGFQVTFAGFSPRCSIVVMWDSTVIDKLTYTPAAVKEVVPGYAAPGTHRVSVHSGCQQQAGAVFTVLAKPAPAPTSRTTPPAPTTSLPPPPTPAPTAPGGPIPTRPGSPPTAPGPNPTASMRPPGPTPTGTSTTTIPSPDGSFPPPGTPGPNGPSPAFPPNSSGQLVLDRGVVAPGDPLRATGTGCQPGAEVTLSSGDETLGRTTADTQGQFATPVRLAHIRPGRLPIAAECGVVLTAGVDLVVSSSTGGLAQTHVLLLFFLLIGAALIRWQFTGSRRR